MERRKTARNDVLEPAVIVFGRTGSVNCTIQNLSADGACLEVDARANPAIIPQDILLYQPAKRTLKPCRIVWRAFLRVGVQFK